MDTIKTIITIDVIVEKAQKISTLSTPNLTTRRRDGNTTRQVNFAIEKLYEGYIVVVEDHYISRMTNARLFNLILKRLESENELSYLFETKKIRVDKNRLEIELV